MGAWGSAAVVAALDVSGSRLASAIVLAGAVLVAARRMRQAYEWPGLPASIALSGAVVLVALRLEGLAILTALGGVLGIAAAYFGRRTLRWLTLAGVLCFLVWLASSDPGAARSTDRAPGRPPAIDAPVDVDALEEEVRAARTDLARARDSLAWATAEATDEQTELSVRPDDARVREAALELAVAEAALAEAESEPEPSSIVDALTTKAEAWITYAWDSVTGSTETREVSPVGWVLVVTALILLYRQMEIISASREPGPITLVDLTGDVDEKAAPLQRALFRAALDLTDLRNPPSIPGGAETERLLKVFQEENADVHGWVAAAGKLANLLVGVLFPKVGYDVTLTLQRTGASDDELSTTVRLSSARTGGVVRAETLPPREIGDAIGIAAFEVARWVSIRSGRTPPWARWRSGEAWWRYQRALSGARSVAQAGGDGTADGRTAEIEEFDSIMRSSPGTAIGRVALGIAHDKAGAYAEALRNFAEVATDQNRLLVNRYRLGVSYAFLADPVGDEYWRSAPEPVRDDAVAAVVAATDGAVARQICGHDADDANARGLAQVLASTEEDGRADRRRAFLALAAAEYAVLLHRYTPWWLAWNGFARPDERSFSLATLKDRHGLVERRAVTTTAGLICELNTQLDDACDVESIEALAREVEAEVARPHTGSQTDYNAACFYAIAARQHPRFRDRAMALLQAYVRDPEGKTVSLEWMQDDPDLGALADDPRLQRMVARLERRPVEPATSPGAPLPLVDLSGVSQR